MLRVEGLSCSYGQFQALFGVTLHCAPGEAVALIGANGAGKSTLLRTLAGAQRARPDAIRIDGHPVGGDDERAQLGRGIALVPEGRRLFASLTVEENLLLAARNGRGGPWTVERLLAEIPGMAAWRNRPATALSGGQQQLVAIARALACNPVYLLCDEVSLGLSPRVVDEVHALLTRARQEGVALLLVEQNVQRALAASQRFYCLQRGRVVLEGVSAQADRHAVAEAYFGV